jgi:hypothetical protein
MWSWTARQPGVFSAITLSALRGRSSMIEPSKVTAPSAGKTPALAKPVRRFFLCPPAMA